jgi:hypothetical protein
LRPPSSIGLTAGRPRTLPPVTRRLAASCWRWWIWREHESEALLSSIRPVCSAAKACAVWHAHRSWER